MLFRTGVSASVLAAIALLPILTASACSSSPSESNNAATRDAGAGDNDADVGANQNGDAETSEPESVPSCDAIEDTAVQGFVGQVKKGFVQTKTVGASVAIVREGHVYCTLELGLRAPLSNSAGNPGANSPVTSRTRFAVASLSKVITAAAVLSLVRDGVINVSKPITTYLPPFQLKNGDASQITVQQLLNHTSGIQDSIDDFAFLGFAEAKNCEPSRDEWIRTRHPSLWAPPGEVYNYSNLNYFLLGALVEAVAGKSYESVVEERIFKPAGMDRATFDKQLVAEDDHATGYEVEGDVTKPFTPDQYDCAYLNPFGGLYATPTDYARFALWMTTFAPGMLDATSAGWTETRGRAGETYNHGLMTETNIPFWHGGSLPGYLSEMLVFPKRKFSVIAFANSRGTKSFVDPACGLAVIQLTGPLTKVPDGHTDPSTWSAYEGKYVDSAGDLGTVDVALVNGQLSITSKYSGMSGVFTQLDHDAFAAPSGLDAVFWRDGSGVPKYVVTRIGVAVRQ